VAQVVIGADVDLVIDRNGFVPGARRWILGIASNRVLTGYSQGTHRVLAGYSQGTRRVLAGYAQGTPSALTTTSSVPNEPVRVGCALMHLNAVAHALADRLMLDSRMRANVVDVRVLRGKDVPPVAPARCAHGGSACSGRLCAGLPSA
jgi:hypothetical protein